MQLHERALATLPEAEATRLIRALFAPGERFSRAFHHYWKNVLGQDEATACQSTLAELGSVARALIGNLGDRDMHTIGLAGANGYQPIGIFGYRALSAHGHGRKLAEVIASTHLRARYGHGATHGIAHCVGILDAHANLDVLKTIFVSIARKALARGHRHLFFFTSDHRLKGLYRRFGMVFPPDLGFADSQHLVGSFDLGAVDNLARVVEIETHLGLGVAAPALSQAA